MNKIHLIGNVVHTPEMRTTQSGVSVCKFSIAVKRKFKDQATGDYATDFFDVQAWRQLADNCGKFLEKGMKVAVVGAMQSRDYEGKDGGKRRAWEVMADEVEFLSRKSDGAQQTGAPAPHSMNREQANAAMQMAKALGAQAVHGFTVADDEELPF